MSKIARIPTITFWVVKSESFWPTRLLSDVFVGSHLQVKAKINKASISVKIHWPDMPTKKGVKATEEIDFLKCLVTKLKILTLHLNSHQGTSWRNQCKLVLQELHGWEKMQNHQPLINQNQKSWHTLAKVKGFRDFPTVVISWQEILIFRLLPKSGFFVQKCCVSKMKQATYFFKLIARFQRQIQWLSLNVNDWLQQRSKEDSTHSGNYLPSRMISRFIWIDESKCWESEGDQSLPLFHAWLQTALSCKICIFLGSLQEKQEINLWNNTKASCWSMCLLSTSCNIV